LTGFLLTLAVAAAAETQAQRPDTFAAYLDWVPISGAERNDVAGRGSASALLSGGRLSITGSFDGMVAAATRATLHQSAVTGVHGPEIAELAITQGPSGTFEGEVRLTREQREALLAGRLYLQIAGERGVPPDNAVLWGWLLAERGAR
jgi:hypothetical protein